mgnify:CR=1 FL=1
MLTLELVAYDIETTSVEGRHEATVVWFAVPVGVRVFVQTYERAAPDVEASVRDRVETHVQVSIHDSERVLLEAVGAFATVRLDGNDVLLVAFDGELWRSGFDLPFLRRRELGTLAERYCSKSDFKLKSLTLTRHE